MNPPNNSDEFAQPTCICTTYCQDDREAELAPGDPLCVYCAGIDPYGPCPAIGYGCWPTCGDDEEPCCTPEQRANTAKAWTGTSRAAARFRTLAGARGTGRAATTAPTTPPTRPATEGRTMADLSNATDEELAQELTRRGSLPRCPCGRWKTYIGIYDSDGKTLRCAGCGRPIAKCRCH